MPETIVFVSEKRRETWQLYQKMLAELAKRQRTTTMAAQAEKRHETFIFLTKCIAEDRISVHTPMKRRPFLSKTEGSDAMQLLGISQRHDFADPLGVEPLSL